MKTQVILYRIVIVCLVYHGLRLLGGDGTADLSFTYRLSIVCIWLLLAWVFYRYPEKLSIPISLFMLISVAVQSFLLWTVQAELPDRQLPPGQGWISFFISVLPLFVGGLSACVFRIIESRSKNTAEQDAAGNPLPVE